MSKEYPKMNQIDRIKEIVDWRNKNIQTETYATHMAFDSIEQIIDSEETEINSIILDNINADEKFKIICRAKDIDIDEICRDIIDKIEYSDIEDKQSFISKQELRDEDYVFAIKEYNELHIDKTMLFSRKEAIDFFEVSNDEIEEVWIELNEAEKELIQIALNCKVYDIECDMG